jgi:nitroreductase
MDFEQIVRSRYACKKFDGRVVPDETMDKLYDLIRLAPSSVNLQPWRIKVVTDRTLKEKLRAVSRGQEQITTCSHLLIFCTDTKLEEKMGQVQEAMRKASIGEETISSYGERISAFISKKNEEERVRWAERQTFLALENALLGAKSLGLDSCPMEGVDKPEYERILELPSHLRVLVVCPIGYAADAPRVKVRLPKEEVFF